MDGFTGWAVFIGLIAVVWWAMVWVTSPKKDDKDEPKESDNGYGSEKHRHYVAHEEAFQRTPTRHDLSQGKELGRAKAAPPSPFAFARRRGSTDLSRKQPPIRGRETEQRPVVTEDSSGGDATLAAFAAGAALGSLLSSKGDSDSGCSSGSSFSGGGGSFDGGGSSSSYSDSSSSSDSGSSSSSDGGGSSNSE